jgi:hypothetical protein
MGEISRWLMSAGICSFIFPGFIDQVKNAGNLFRRQGKYLFPVRFSIIFTDVLLDIKLFEPAIPDFPAGQVVADSTAVFKRHIMAQAAAVRGIIVELFFHNYNVSLIIIHQVISDVNVKLDFINHVRTSPLN